MNLRLQNLVIPARHFKQTLHFYRGTLGLEVASQGEGFCNLKTSGVNLAIRRSDGANPFVSTGHGIYLDFVVESVLQTKRQMESARVSIAREWSDADRKYLLVADPEGNLVEFIEPLKAGT